MLRLLWLLPCLTALEQAVQRTNPGDLSADLIDLDEFEGFELREGKPWLNEERESNWKRKMKFQHRLKLEQESSVWTLWGLVPYKWEYWLGALALVYATNFLYGREVNNAKAQHWHKLLLEVLADKQAGECIDACAKRIRMHKDALSVYKIYFAPRSKCTGVIATLELFPRWDLLFHFLSLFGRGASSSDNVMTVELPLVHGAMEPFVLAIARKGEISLVKKNYRSVRKLASSVACKALPPGYALMTDCPAVISRVLDDKVIAFLNKHDVRLLLITDYNHLDEEVSLRLNKCVVRLKLKLSSKEQMTKGAPVAAKVALRVMELVGDVQFGQQMRSKANAMRQKIKWERQ